MPLPDFLIIGARKSGTTWLYEVLKSHSEISMANDRKEVHFFDRYYDKGVNWYSNKFPNNFNGLIGEATPNYLSYSKCAFRINETLGEVKLICILRNPINRFYSAYKYLVQEKNYKKNFKQATEEYPEILTRGLYYNQIKNYLNYFDKKDMKFLIFEEAIFNKDETLKEICDFLGVQENLKIKNTNKKSNASKIPRFSFLYAIGKQIVRKLYDYDIVFLVNLMKKLGLKKIFFSSNNKNEFPKMDDETKEKLKEYYYNDVEKTEKLLGKDLKEIWQFK